MKPAIRFDHSPALVRLRQTVGDATRSLNGIFVALETLQCTPPIKPPDLVYTWHASNNPEDIAKARVFAMRSAMVVVIDGVDRYLRAVTRFRGLVDDELSDFLNGRRVEELNRRPTISERLRKLAEFVPGATYENLLLVFDLLAVWRNQFVHGEHRHGAPARTLAKLMNEAKWFTENRGDADIVGTVTRYRNGESPSLIDLATMFSAAQRICSDIDERLLLQQDGKTYAPELLRFLLSEQADPNVVREHLFEQGGKSSIGRVHELFNDWGAKHDANCRSNAPSIARSEFDAIFSIGRNKARIDFRV